MEWTKEGGWVGWFAWDPGAVVGTAGRCGVPGARPGLVRSWGPPPELHPPNPTPSVLCIAPKGDGDGVGGQRVGGAGAAQGIDGVGHGVGGAHPVRTPAHAVRVASRHVSILAFCWPCPTPLPSPPSPPLLPLPPPSPRALSPREPASSTSFTPRTASLSAPGAGPSCTSEWPRAEWRAGRASVPWRRWLPAPPPPPLPPPTIKPLLGPRPSLTQVAGGPRSTPKSLAQSTARPTTRLAPSASKSRAPTVAATWGGWCEGRGGAGGVVWAATRPTVPLAAPSACPPPTPSLRRPAQARV